MGRTERTVTLTPERQKIYEDTRERALKIADICSVILDEKKTEAKACADIGYNAASFRKFCKWKPLVGDRNKITEKDWEDDWRENLLFELTGERISAPDDFDIVFRDLCKQALTNIQADVLQAHLDGFAYEDLGEKYGLTRERIRQIENKVLRILRRPDRCARLVYGDNYYSSLQERNDAWSKYAREFEFAEKNRNNSIKQKTLDLKEEADAYKANAETIGFLDGNMPDKEREMSRVWLDELDLSVRACNRLRIYFLNQGIDKPTALDVSKLTISEIRSIPKMGKGSINDIQKCFRKRFAYSFMP